MLNYKLYDTQAAFVCDPARFSAFIGGVGSGKTTAGAVKALLEMLEIGGLGLVVAPTYPMLRDATLRTFRELAGPLVKEFSKTEMRVALQNGAEALFRSADEPDRLRGPNVAWAWVDEAALCPPQTWDIVIGRVREGPRGGRAWLTTTPRGRNWVYEVVSRPDVSVYRAATADNPFLPADFIRSLQEAYTGPFARQELYGEFVALEGLVYEQFSRDRHVSTVTPSAREVVGGVDFGYTNPTAVVIVALDSDGRAYVLDEFYQRRVTLDDLIVVLQDFQRQYGVSRFFCDPSEPGAIETLRRAGLPAQPARARSILDGIRAIQARLAADPPRLLVSPRCANLIAEFESYVWSDSKTREMPEKVNDHALDALRYALSLPAAKVLMLE